MPQKYPPLTYRQVINILRALHFRYSHSRGDHDHYIDKDIGGNHLVTVKRNVDVYDDFLIKSMIAQSGVGRKQFYGATKATAKKIGLKLRNR